MAVPRLLLLMLVVFLYGLAVYSHLAPEEKPRDDKSLESNSSLNLLDFPAVSIMGEYHDLGCKF